MSLEDDRKKRNEDLVARMKKGESLTQINLLESWFPVRPTIKKDEKALEFLKSKINNRKKLEIRNE